MKRKKNLESDLNLKRKTLATVLTYQVQDILDGLSYGIPFKFGNTEKQMLSLIKLYDSECSVLRKSYSEHEVKPPVNPNVLNPKENPPKPSLPVLTGKVVKDMYSEAPDGRKVRVVKYEDGIGIEISSTDLNGNPNKLKFGLRPDAAKALRMLLQILDV